jgi:hypothetical protein
MISRARHGVILLRAGSVEDRNGVPRAKEPSRFLEVFDGIAGCGTTHEIEQWLRQADWDRLSTAT